MRDRRLPWYVCCAAVLVLALPASAQLSREGGRTQIGADKLDVAERDSIAVYSGDVDVVQGDARLRADTLTINFAGNAASQNGGGFGEILTMMALGNVYYITPALRAKGDQGTYDAKTEEIVLTGNVIVSRCEDVAQGQRLTFNVSTGQSSLDGQDSSDGKPSRVVTIIGRPAEGETNDCAQN